MDAAAVEAQRDGAGRGQSKHGCVVEGDRTVTSGIRPGAKFEGERDPRYKVQTRQSSIHLIARINRQPRKNLSLNTNIYPIIRD